MNPYTRLEEIRPEDTFRFECRNCGDCCRNVAQTVMIESLDLFRLSRYLKLEASEAANQFTEAVTIAWGAPILVLKAKPAGDVCVFLKNGKCSIHQAKPRTCRLYPLSMGPDDADVKNFLVFKSPERAFHYTGTEHNAGKWVTENMDQESYAYIVTEYRLLRELGKIMRRIPREREDAILTKMLLFRYFMFDSEEDFMPQYVRNMAILKRELHVLAEK